MSGMQGRNVELSLVVMTVLLLLLGVAEGGLLEEKLKLRPANTVEGKGAAPVEESVYCIFTDRSGVLPCDKNPKCCHADGPRVKGTDYCCPTGATQYYFKTGNTNEVVCACAL